MSKVSSTCNICKQRPPWNINHGAEGVLPLNLAIEVNYHEILERVKSPQGSKRSTVGYFCPTAFQNGLFLSNCLPKWAVFVQGFPQVLKWAAFGPRYPEMGCFCPIPVNTHKHLNYNVQHHVRQRKGRQ